MLRIVQNSNVAGAKSYYSTADYYTEGQELTGIWRGEGAKLLGLEGEVTKDSWDALCDTRDPNTGKTLTLRLKAEPSIWSMDGINLWTVSSNPPSGTMSDWQMTKSNLLVARVTSTVWKAIKPSGKTVAEVATFTQNSRSSKTSH